MYDVHTDSLSTCTLSHTCTHLPPLIPSPPPPTHTHTHWIGLLCSSGPFQPSCSLVGVVDVDMNCSVLHVCILEVGLLIYDHSHRSVSVDVADSHRCY